MAAALTIRQNVLEAEKRASDMSQVFPEAADDAVKHARLRVAIRSNRDRSQSLPPGLRKPRDQGLAAL